MRSITILCVGTLKEPWLRQAAGEYQKRLSPYCRLRIVEVSEEKLPQTPSAAQCALGIEKEGERLLGKLPAGAFSAALCIEGETLSSEEFSARLESLMSRGEFSELVFLIGGSGGLSEEVKKRSGWKLSLSRLTFTHQLSRVLLLEQLYRAFQIQSGGKYHK